MNACKAGRTECSSGAPVCVDGTDKPGGTSCGTNLICDGAGACVTCMEGAACGTNPTPCKTGKLTCGGSAPGCQDDAAKALGATCGTDQVCNAAGQCVACVAMQPCSTNPTACKQGVTSCASGASECVDSTANRTAGASCGTNQVCSPTGTCIPCTVGAACSGNPDPCKLGALQCSTGQPVCGNSTLNAPNATPCGMGQTCNSGLCGMCVQGAACSGNPNPCKAGTRDCSGSMPACNDTAQDIAAGTSCGTNMVCNGSGTCVQCTPGGSCTANPGAPCKTGAFARSGSACVCADSGNAGPGTSCGAATFGPYGACSYADVCALSGSRTRTRTDPVCSNGACTMTMTTETDTSGCGRSTDGTSCGGAVCSAFGACTYADPTCSNSGTRSRTCTPAVCVSGACGNGAAYTDTDTAGCARNQDGRTCGGGTVCTGCNYASTCATAGAKDCNDYACANSVCAAGPKYQDSTGCGRVTDDQPCGLSASGVESVCHTGLCSCGCKRSGLCYPGTAKGNCGWGGMACATCGTTLGYCETTVNPGRPYCDYL